MVGVMRIAVVAAIGCGGHAPVPPPDPVVPGAPTDEALAPQAGPTDDECDALIAHAIELQTPGDAGLDSAERTTLTGEVRARVLARCRATPRATYHCAMAATTTDELTRCDR
jgi:hypothetical protein